MSWEERRVAADNPAHRVFERPSITSLVRTLSGCNVIQRLDCWLATYRLGEYINLHRDASGSMQIVACMSAPHSTANGGYLLIEKTPVILGIGDAVIFDATRLEHETTPLIATAGNKQPQRIVLVARYYLQP